MTFSKEWNFVYEKNLHRNNWPFSDLISYTIKHSKINKKKIRVLELGCGSGPNIPFFVSNNSEYFGLDGSTFMINQLKKKFPKLKNNLVACDFTREIPFRKTFDLVVDRSSLTHNSTSDIQNCLELIHKKLNSGGKYIGIDWHSTNHFEYKNGKTSSDSFTKNKFKTGQFKKLGNVHFSNKKHLLDIFEKFKIEILEEKIVKRKIPNDNKIFAVWNIVAKKK
jgi:SAM-dependent methyltransferase